MAPFAIRVRARKHARGRSLRGVTIHATTEPRRWSLMWIVTAETPVPLKQCFCHDGRVTLGTGSGRKWSVPVVTALAAAVRHWRPAAGTGQLR